MPELATDWQFYDFAPNPTRARYRHTGEGGRTLELRLEERQPDGSWVDTEDFAKVTHGIVQGTLPGALAYILMGAKGRRDDLKFVLEQYRILRGVGVLHEVLAEIAERLKSQREPWR